MTQANNLSPDFPSGFTLVGTFENVQLAEKAIDSLRKAGFYFEDISVVTRDNQNQIKEISGEEGATLAISQSSGGSSMLGSLGGGTLGAVLGWLMAGGASLIPGIGPVIAAGIFSATVSGALLGGIVGGITAALGSHGIPEAEAAEYEDAVKAGQTLVTICVNNIEELIRAQKNLLANQASSTRYYDPYRPGPGKICNLPVQNLYGNSIYTGNYF